MLKLGVTAEAAAAERRIVSFTLIPIPSLRLSDGILHGQPSHRIAKSRRELKRLQTRSNMKLLVIEVN